MVNASVVFMICLIVLAGIVGVAAAAFERRRVRENVAPDRVPRRFRLGRRGAERAERRRAPRERAVRERAQGQEPRQDQPDQGSDATPGPADAAAYERTRRLPDGSSGGRFEED